MEHPASLGLPFSLHLLDHAPRFSHFQEDLDTIFDPLDTTLPPLHRLYDNPPAHFDLTLRLPDLCEVEAMPFDNVEDPAHAPAPLSPSSSPPPPPLASAHVSEEQHDASPPNCWQLYPGDAPSEGPRLCTWETFEKKDGADSGRTAYLSEAGPLALDAALLPLHESIGVLPQDFTLRALCSLSVGRSSALFRWNRAGDQLEQLLPATSISGLSLQCSNGLIQSFRDGGSRIARLRNYADPARLMASACPAAIALRSCVASILGAVDESISAQLGRVKSLLQLQELTARPQQLLKLMESLVTVAKGLSADQSIISTLSSQIHLEVETHPRFCRVMRAILARVAAPWLEALAADLGLASSATSTLLTTAGEAEPNFTATGDLTFLSAADDFLIRDITSSIKLLREQLPNHFLLRSYQSGAYTHISGSTVTSQNMVQVARQYETDMIALLVQSTFGNDMESLVLGIGGNEQHAELHSEGREVQAEFVTSLENLMSQMPQERSQHPMDELHVYATHALRDAYDEECLSSSTLDFDPEASSSPVDQIRPLITVQHRLINGVLLRQLLREHNLRWHLELQHSFQLLGDGSFVARLTRALFDRDVQSAERKRGMIPTAEAMGLRLGHHQDQRWPPASSELQLTLMGLLVESSGSSNQRSSTDRQHRLSFAIRELPEVEIDRVLDPYSVYALDFLRIQYTVRAPVDAVVTAHVLDQYDTIFRYLLKLLRLVHVTSNLPRKAVSLRNHADEERTMTFVHGARHFVNVLMTHAMDLGIAAPWISFMASVKALEQSLDAEDTTGEIGSHATTGIEGLRHMHEACLDRIRSRLFLKRKQEKLRRAIESVFSRILQAESALHASKDEDTLNATGVQAFRDDMSRLTVLLQETVGKPPRSLDAADAEDADMMRVLLFRLNWNGHYDVEQ